MTHKLATFSKAILAVAMLTSSVAFAQNAPGNNRANTGNVAGAGCNSFIPADGVVGEGAGSRAAVCSGFGGLSKEAIIVGAVIGALAIAAASSGTSGTTGSQ